MFKLTCENFIKAQNYIFANGDDINCAWFRYLFEGNDTEAFLNVLAKYQYENGGFGGIYYEFDYKGPCLKATEIAVKIGIEQAQYYTRLIRKIIDCFKRKGTRLDFDVDNVDHADIISEELTEPKNNNC